MPFTAFVISTKTHPKVSKLNAETSNPGDNNNMLAFWPIIIKIKRKNSSRVSLLNAFFIINKFVSACSDNILNGRAGDFH